MRSDLSLINGTLCWCCWCPDGALILLRVTHCCVSGWRNGVNLTRSRKCRLKWSLSPKIKALDVTDEVVRVGLLLQHLHYGLQVTDFTTHEHLRHTKTLSTFKSKKTRNFSLIKHHHSKVMNMSCCIIDQNNSPTCSWSSGRWIKSPSSNFFSISDPRCVLQNEMKQSHVLPNLLPQFVFQSGNKCPLLSTGVFLLPLLPATSVTHTTLHIIWI